MCNYEDRYFLRVLDILFLDDIGQVPAEIVSALDVILLTFRYNDVFVGVLLVMYKMEHTKIQHIRGEPFYSLIVILLVF